MPFSINPQTLFNATSGLGTPDFNTTGAFNIGSAIGKAKFEQDPKRLFLQSLFARVAKDRENKYAQDLYNQQMPNNPLPAQDALSSTLFGLQAPPIELMTALAKLKESGTDSLLKNAQTNYYNARSAPVADQSTNPDLIPTGGVDAYGRPTYKSKNYMNFINENQATQAEARRKILTDNPTIDQDTQRAIAANEYIQPRMKRIESALSSGALSGGVLEKLMKEVTITSTNDLIVPNGHPLEEIMGAINDIKLTGFALGGAAYTGTEAEKIESRLSPIGKSAERWKADLKSLPEFFQEKARAGIMSLDDARKKYGTDSTQIGSTQSGNKFKKVS